MLRVLLRDCSKKQRMKMEERKRCVCEREKRKQPIYTKYK